MNQRLTPGSKTPGHALQVFHQFKLYSQACSVDSHKSITAMCCGKQGATATAVVLVQMLLQQHQYKHEQYTLVALATWYTQSATARSCQTDKQERSSKTLLSPLQNCVHHSSPQPLKTAADLTQSNAFSHHTGFAADWKENHSANIAACQTTALVTKQLRLG